MNEGAKVCKSCGRRRPLPPGAIIAAIIAVVILAGIGAYFVEEHMAYERIKAAVAAVPWN